MKLHPFLFPIMTATLVQGGLSLFPSAAVAQSAGAQLQIVDVFQTPDGEPTPGRPLITFTELNASVIPTLWPQLDGELEAKRFDVVLATSEVLLAWLPQDSTEYGEALWYRALSYEGMNDLDRVDRVAGVYLKNYSKGPHVGWFLVRVARGWSKESKPVEAANAWLLAINGEYALTEAESLEAAQAFDAAFRPAEALRALEKAGQGADSSSGRKLKLRALVLLADKTAVPPVLENASADAEELLLHGMLMELRGDRAGAVTLYRESRAKGSDTEVNALAARRLADRWQPWPPVAPTSQ